MAADGNHWREMMGTRAQRAPFAGGDRRHERECSSSDRVP
jgi:hypothetical protein